MVIMLQERLFLSDKLLKDELDQLDRELANRQPVNRDEMPDLEVVDMDKDHITFTIKVSNIDIHVMICYCLHMCI